MAIEWRQMDEPYTFGVEATVGNRRAEVVLTDSCCSHWSAYFYIDGVMQRGQGPDKVTRATAKSLATKFLRGES